MKHSAGVIVIRDDGAVLLQHRDNIPNISYPDHWGLPAGMVEGNEDFKKAALRELQEETGCVPEDVELLTEEIWEEKAGTKVTRHVFWTMYDNKQEIQCNEGQEMRFVQLTEFEGKKIFPGQERLLKLAVEKANERGFLK